MGEANDLEGLSEDDEILIAALAEGRYTHAAAGALAAQPAPGDSIPWPS